MAANSEALYRDGVTRWAARDLDAATDRIAAAIAASPGPEEDTWWYAATRALAQIAMERDDPDVAAFNLRRLPGTLVGDAQTHALRARVALLRGDHAGAEEALGRAVRLLAHDRERDIGSLMNGALALASCAEVLVELGYGDEAARVVAQALERTSRAGIHDEVLVRWLALSAAGAARLRGDALLVDMELAAVEADAGDDLGARAARERARCAWDAGDGAGAARWYDEAVAQATAHHHPALARLVREERPAGPPAMRHATRPIEHWAGIEPGDLGLPDEPVEEAPPYAVIITLAVDGDPGRFAALEAAVRTLLDARPALGLVDGTATDGVAWELYLDGDDAEALWAGVRPLVEVMAPARGSQATVRHPDGGWRIEPLAPPL